MPNERGWIVKQGKTDGKALVVRRNELIHARYRMTLQEQRLLLWLIAQVKREDTDFTVYQISVKELAAFIGIEKNKKIYEELAGTTKSLMTRLAEIRRVEDDTLTQIQFVSKTKYYFGNGLVELCLNEHMRPYILELKERFTEVELQYAIRMSSFYACRVYELLKCEAYKGSFTIDMEEFRALLGIEDSKLRRINNFKAKVMDIAEREINTRTDIVFTYEWVRRGRKAAGIKFTVKQQKKQPVDFLPASSNDRLRLRLEAVGMPSQEAVRVVKEYAKDPERISWHLDELERLVKAEKAKKPLAWLRAALKKDYRPQMQMSFAERKAEAAERKRDEERRRRPAKRSGDTKHIADVLTDDSPLGNALRKNGRRRPVTARDCQRAIELA